MTHTAAANSTTPITPTAIRRAGWILAILAIPLFVGLTLSLGKEAGWDFQNYHWYDPYALLTGRLGFDIAVAHHATYYNPLLDVPLYWLGSRFPAWVVAVWLGSISGIAAALLGALAYRVVKLEDPRARLAVAALLAIAGMIGGGTFTEIGTTPNDIGSGLGMLGSLLLAVSQIDRLRRADRADWLLIGTVGLLAGLSPGLKLTTIPYPVGLELAMLALPGSPWTRVRRGFVFGLGVLAGMGIGGGYWYWTLWRFSGNPFFPYFNDLFASPLVPPGSYRDERFLPNGIWQKLIFPFVFSADSTKSGEWSFRDVHVAMAYVVAPICAGVVLFARRREDRLVQPDAARLLLIGVAGTYFVWLNLFGIYRYIIPLEMLCPILIFTALSLLPVSRRHVLIATAALLVLAQAFAVPGGDPRLSWRGNYVEARVPELPDPQHSLVLMTETAPMAYVIPAFSPDVPFLRIQGWLIGSKDRESGFGKAMHDRVANHQGPIYLLHWPRELEMTRGSVKDYGLKIDDAGCQTIETNLSSILDQGYKLQLCPLERISQ